MTSADNSNLMFEELFGVLNQQWEESLGKYGNDEESVEGDDPLLSCSLEISSINRCVFEDIFEATKSVYRSFSVDLVGD
jgi:hypothetical protein